MSKNLSELSGRKGLRENLFEELGISAKATGTPDQATMEKLSEKFLIGNANVYGAVTFYDFLKPENKGKKAYVCNGSACMTAGTQDAVREKLLGTYRPEEIGEMCCLGRCHENSSFHIGGLNYSGSDIEQLDTIKAGKGKTNETYNVGSIGTPILTSDYGSPDNYYDIFRACLHRIVERTI